MGFSVVTDNFSHQAVNELETVISDKQQFSLKAFVSQLWSNPNYVGNTTNKLECIPVGYVPPAAVAVQGDLHQAAPRDQVPRRPDTQMTRQPPPRTRHSSDQAPLGPDTPHCEQNHRHL